MCRANALTAVKRAGSGHLGSSFSALDLVVHLLFEELNVAELGWDDPDRDVFFSSKGHDVPGLYAALHALGVIPADRLLRLRRLGGLDGHPDVGVPGIEANSGSLGMGISKGRGIAWAKRFLGRGGRVVVHRRRRRAAGGPELRGAAGRRAPARRPALGDRRPQRAPVRQADGGDPRARRPRPRSWRVRLAGRDAATGTTTPRCARVFERFRAGDDAPEGARRRTRSRAGASRSWSTPRARGGGGTYRWHAGAPGRRGLRTRARRDRRTDRRAARRARAAAARARAGAAARRHAGRLAAG